MILELPDLGLNLSSKSIYGNQNRMFSIENFKATNILTERWLLEIVFLGNCKEDTIP